MFGNLKKKLFTISQNVNARFYTSNKQTQKPWCDSDKNCDRYRVTQIGDTEVQFTSLFYAVRPNSLIIPRYDQQRLSIKVSNSL